ncbi:MAG: lipoxygenase family protein [Pseudomonadota bacterium]|nr:lipoxygenase family protein [Pseudomonadota bacterium]
MSDYEYNYTYIPSVAMVQTVPSDAKPTFHWLLAVVKVALTIAKNRFAPAVPDGLEPTDTSAGMLPLDHLGVAPIHLPSADIEGVDLDGAVTTSDVTEDAVGGGIGLLGQMTGIATALAKKGTTDPFRVLEELLKDLKGPSGRPSSIEDYRDLFRTIPLPAIADDFDANATFAALRVAGYNPLVIQGVDAPSFPATDAHLAAAGLADDTLAAAGLEGRLYLADYAALKDVVNGAFPDGPKYAFAPKALFVRPRTGGGLVPVAIQCGQDADSYRVFGNADGEAWRRAKVLVNSADANHHELVSHLGHTHLVIEAFAIATPRRLAESHPVRRLLTPHLEGTLSINDAAQRTLITAGHQVDAALGGTIDASRAVSVAAVHAFDFEAAFLPNALAARRVVDPALAYPYRDDAQKLWGAIRDWAQANVVNAYADDDALKADADLAAWAAELAADDGARLASFGEAGQRGKILTRSWLTDALTMVIFTASCQHAAVNFAQAEFMTYAPAVPGGVYRAAPLSVADTAKNPSLDLLPPLDVAQTQLEFLQLLGSVHYTTLGDYGPFAFVGTGLKGALGTFQARLQAIEAEIDTANKSRVVYTLLKPSLIPQSINI